MGINSGVKYLNAWRVSGSQVRGGIIRDFQSTGIDDNSTGTTVTVDNSNNVGIGDTSPQSTLHLRQSSDNSAGGFRISRTNQAASFTYWVDTSSKLNIGYGNPDTVDPSTGNIVINTEGDVGIGIASPSVRLQVDEQISTGTGGSGFDETAPGFTFGGQETQVGMFLPTSNQLAFATGATERVRIDSSGQVGIGTNSPQSLLHLSKSAPILYFEDEDAGADADGDWTIRTTYDGGTGASSLSIQNQGAGFGSGGTIFEVQKNGSDNPRFGFATDLRSDAIMLMAQNLSTNSAHGFVINDNSVGDSGTAGFRFETDSDETTNQRGFQMVGDHNGTPYDAFYCEASGKVYCEGDSPGLTMLDHGTDIARLASFNGNFIIEADVNNTQAGSVITFDVDGSEVARIDSSGNVGIGISSPGDKLQLDSGFLGLSGSPVAPSGSSQGFTTETGGGIRVYTDSTRRATFDALGNFLVGTTSTTINTSNFGIVLNGAGTLGKVEASADLGAASAAHAFWGNAGRVEVRGDGDLLNTNGNYGTLSDPRLKQDITPAHSQWDDVKELGQRFVNYRLKESVQRQGDDAPMLLSVLADDDFAASFPGLTKTGDDGYRSFKQSVASMKAIVALSEALQRIEALEAKVNA